MASPITNPTVVQYVNQRARPAANLLAQCFSRMESITHQWTALGSGQAALDALSVSIGNAAGALTNAYDFCFRSEKVWFLGVNTLVPNDATIIADGSGPIGSGGDGRPQATGQAVNGVMTVVIQMQNWLFSATESFTDTARNNAGAYNTVLTVSPDGPPPPLTLSNAGNFINRCNELVSYCTASSNLNLNLLLALANLPNPTS